jgi:hypothetical protein
LKHDPIGVEYSTDGRIFYSDQFISKLRHASNSCLAIIDLTHLAELKSPSFTCY